jgi:hypothetical protein
VFEKQLISDRLWPSRSSDLNPLIFTCRETWKKKIIFK